MVAGAPLESEKIGTKDDSNDLPHEDEAKAG